MAEPPPSGPHSYLAGVNRDARVGAPTHDTDGGDAQDKADAEDASAARPAQTPPDR